MAYQISEKIIKEYSKKKYFFLKFQLKNWQNIRRFRKLVRFVKKPFYKKKQIINFESFLNTNRNDIEKIKKFYNENSFCFIENVLNDNFYQELINNLPGKEFFQPPRIIEKQYDFGFKWIVDDEQYNKDVNFYHFDELNFFFKKLRTEEFENWIGKITQKDNENKLRLYSFITSIAEKDSILFCHKDSITNLNENTTVLKKNSALNCIFFIKGINNQNNTGATGIYKTNDFSNPIFVPKILNNSLLIYKSDANLYHGFDKMKKNSFRFTINTQFISK